MKLREQINLSIMDSFDIILFSYLVFCDIYVCFLSSTLSSTCWSFENVRRLQNLFSSVTLFSQNWSYISPVEMILELANKYMTQQWNNILHKIIDTAIWIYVYYDNAMGGNDVDPKPMEHVEISTSNCYLLDQLLQWSMEWLLSRKHTATPIHTAIV